MPPLGSASVAQVGETMISSAQLTTFPGLKLIVAIRPSGKYDSTYMVHAALEAGHHRQVGIDGKGGRYFASPSGVRLAYETAGKVADPEPDKYTGGIHLAADGSTSVYWFWPGYKRPVMVAAPSAPIEVAPIVVSTPSAFRRELVYAGRGQGGVSVLYREFLNDLVRPAFTQSLQYDLSSGRVIGFRSARFEVVDADNTSIRYRVMSPLE